MTPILPDPLGGFGGFGGDGQGHPHANGIARHFPRDGLGHVHQTHQTHQFLLPERERLTSAAVPQTAAGTAVSPDKPTSKPMAAPSVSVSAPRS